MNLQIKGNVAYAREKDLYKEQALPLNQYKNWRDNGAYRWKNVTWGYEHIGQFSLMMRSIIHRSKMVKVIHRYVQVILNIRI